MADLFKTIREADKWGDLEKAKETHPEEIAQLLNTLEFMAYLVNKRLVEPEHVIPFFGDAMAWWFEELLGRDVQLQGKYSEFVRFYKDFRAPRHVNN